MKNFYRQGHENLNKKVMKSHEKVMNLPSGIPVDTLNQKMVTIFKKKSRNLALES
jgi:hypothetical protein